MTLISHRRYTQLLFIICNNPTPSREQYQPTPSREQYQACLNIAEARRRKTTVKLASILPRREGGRQQSSLLEYCRGAEEEDEVNTHAKKGKIMSQVNNEIYAAISMALYELQGAMMHDDEPGIITIKPRQTAWKTPQQIILSR